LTCGRRPAGRGFRPDRKRWHVNPLRARRREAREQIVAFADNRRVDLQLCERRRRRRRRVRADGDDRVDERSKISDRFLRHAQFRRRTAPEQIARGCGYDGDVGFIFGNGARQLFAR
jgi:hypothetical protein